MHTVSALIGFALGGFQSTRFAGATWSKSASFGSRGGRSASMTRPSLCGVGTGSTAMARMVV